MATTQEEAKHVNLANQTIGSGEPDLWLQVVAVRRHRKGEEMDLSRHALIAVSTPGEETASSSRVRIPRYAFQAADSTATGLANGEHHGETTVQGFSLTADSLARVLGNYPLVELDEVHASLRLSGGIKHPGELDAYFEGSRIEGIRLLSMPLEVEFDVERRCLPTKPQVDSLVKGTIKWAGGEKGAKEAEDFLARQNLRVDFGEGDKRHIIKVFHEENFVAKIRFGEFEVESEERGGYGEYERDLIALRMADVYLSTGQALKATAESTNDDSGDGVTIGEIESDSREG